MKIVVFTGAGMSAESGIRTFRDSNGLWEEYKIEDVATPQAWENDPALVIDFYNKRRKDVLQAQPNKGHLALSELDKHFDTTIITQNIDDLHERAGSKNVVHLHGEIRKARSSQFHNLVYDINGWEMKLGDKCEKGFQLRPHIVWFGEMVPEMDRAAAIVMKADVLIVIGTSLEVYPAASLVQYATASSEKYFIDPRAHAIPSIENLRIINDKTAIAVPKLVKNLINK